MRWRRCSGRLDQASPTQPRFFADGGFYANDHKARFIAPEVPALRTETSASRPLRLNTGRIRDQWHTMTRTGASPRLGQHLPEPFVEIHPDDASKFGVVDGGFARVVTDYGQCILKVVVSERQQRGMLFAPIHWSEREHLGRARRRAGGAVHRSVLRPAREQGDAGGDHAIRICLPWLCAVASQTRSACACLVGARRDRWRLRLSARRQRRSRGLAILAAIGRRR